MKPFPLLQVRTKRLPQLGELFLPPRFPESLESILRDWGKAERGQEGGKEALQRVIKSLLPSKFWNGSEQANKKSALSSWSFVGFLFFLFLVFSLTKQFWLGRRKGDGQIRSSPKSRPDASAGYLSVKSVLYYPKYTKAFFKLFFSLLKQPWCAGTKVWEQKLPVLHRQDLLDLVLGIRVTSWWSLQDLDTP